MLIDALPATGPGLPARRRCLRSSTGSSESCVHAVPSQPSHFALPASFPTMPPWSLRALDGELVRSDG